jgi:hypothetical protein
MAELESDTVAKDLNKDFLSGKMSVADIVKERRKSVLLTRANLKLADEIEASNIIRAENARLYENYETVSLEKKQIGGLQQMERFAKRIQLLQKAIGERAIELTNVQKERDEIQTKVFQLQAKNAKTTGILNSLLAIHHKLRPHNTNPAFNVETYERKEEEIRKLTDSVYIAEREQIDRMLREANALEEAKAKL